MLAVYASQPRLPVQVQPRKTRFRLLVGLGRTGLSTRRGALKGFCHCSGHGVLLPQACPGAPKLQPSRLRENSEGRVGCACGARVGTAEPPCEPAFRTENQAYSTVTTGPSVGSHACATGASYASRSRSIYQTPAAAVPPAEVSARSEFSRRLLARKSHQVRSEGVEMCAGVRRTDRRPPEACLQHVEEAGGSTPRRCVQIRGRSRTW